MRKIVVLILLASLSFGSCLAQKIDNLASFRDIEGANYFRFHYDNDIFFATDADYTQGVGLNL
jgi:hypothetical protein